MNTDNLFEIITEDVDVVNFKLKNNDFGKSFKSFMKDFPGYATDVVQTGTDALQAYKSVKNLTTRFFAKTGLEKKLYSDVVNTLTKSGKFKQVTKKFKDGGIFYELVRT